MNLPGNTAQTSPSLALLDSSSSHSVNKRFYNEPDSVRTQGSEWGSRSPGWSGWLRPSVTFQEPSMLSPAKLLPQLPRPFSSC